MSFKVRKYEDADYNQICELWEKTDMGGAYRGDTPEIIRETIKKDGVLFVLIDSSNDKLIGSSWITNDGRRLHLHHFSILPDYQGKGLSHLLMDTTLKFAKEKNLQIKLEVHQQNNVAIDLYKKYGFAYLGDYDLYIIRDLDIINIK